MNDPIVEEVRKYRNEHAKRFNYDLDAICADLKRHQSLHPQRILNIRKNANKDASCNQPTAAATG